MKDCAIGLYPDVMLFIYTDKSQNKQVVLTQVSEQLSADIQAGKPITCDRIPPGPEAPGPDAEELCLTLDESLYAELSTWCAAKGIAVQQLAIACIDFFAREENQAIAAKMLTAWKQEEESRYNYGDP